MSTSRNERQEVVIAELTHRLRNVYTTIAAAIDSGAQKGDDALRGFAAEMQDRELSLAAAQNGLAPHGIAARGDDQTGTAKRQRIGAFAKDDDGQRQRKNQPGVAEGRKGCRLAQTGGGDQQRG